jgi:hypothetical protein
MVCSLVLHGFFTPELLLVKKQFCTAKYIIMSRVRALEARTVKKWYVYSML